MLIYHDFDASESGRAEGVKTPAMEFGPDGAFASDLRNDAPPPALLRANKLEEDKFLCCIPHRRQWNQSQRFSVIRSPGRFALKYRK